jgi:Domain of unknown function (DUF4034)
MPLYRTTAFCLLLGACFFVASCNSRSYAPKPGTAINPGTAIKPGTVIFVDSAANDPRVHVVPGKLEEPLVVKINEEDPYEDLIRSYLAKGDFDRLDAEAHQARVGKTRFTGGVWKLFSFYFAVANVPEGNPFDESDWNMRLEKLKAWVTAKPRSVTAQIALADAYMNYGWFARGEGAAGTVTPAQWQLFEQRAALARAILTKASQLNEKCPYWYEAMQHVAQAQGWKKEEARELMEKAVSFEPGYYHAYREFAVYLDPRWYGDAGEVEAFADEISTRIGGKKGAFVYFEIASLLTCQCGGDGPARMKKLSWPKIQEGYEALEQLYGVSTLKRSRFAHMAYLAGDKAVTQKVLLQLGDNWDKQSWGSKDHFEEVRKWAVGPRPESNEPGNSLLYVNSSPRNGTDLKVGDQVSLSLTVSYDLATADNGRIYLMLVKDDGSPLSPPPHMQVVAAIKRGTGQATLTDSFAVPPGTGRIHAFVPFLPQGALQSVSDWGFDYPVIQK